MCHPVCVTGYLVVFLQQGLVTWVYKYFSILIFHSEAELLHLCRTNIEDSELVSDNSPLVSIFMDGENDSIPYEGNDFLCKD